MFIGQLPTAATYATWTETIEILDIEDDSAIDLSTFDEIELQVVYPDSDGSVILSLTKTDGEITTPSDGILEWVCDVDTMGGLASGLYEVRLLFTEGTDVYALTGSLPIID